MKVLLFNGSPHKTGCTYTALTEAGKILEENGIETEVIQVGAQPVRGCVACGGCAKGKGCVFGDKDGLNAIIEKCRQADGFLFGSPVYYASPNSLVYNDESYLEDIGEEAVAILYPGVEDFSQLYNTYAYRNLDSDTLDYINTLWENLKIN